MKSEWKSEKIGNVVDIRRGASPRPIHKFLTNTGMPWVKIADATSDFYKYLWKTKEYIIEEGVAKSLLSSLEGKQIYPKDKSKKEVFKESTEEIYLKTESGFVPDGEYVLNRNIKGFGKVNGKAIVQDGVFTVLKGSICGNTGKGYVPSVRRNAKIKDNILQEDIVCMNPSSASWIIIGKHNNGWFEWKDLQGNRIEKYRYKEK